MRLAPQAEAADRNRKVIALNKILGDAVVKLAPKGREGSKMNERVKTLQRTGHLSQLGQTQVKWPAAELWRY